MKRKDNGKIFGILRGLLVLLIFGFLIFLIVYKTMNYLNTSPRFKIKGVLYSPSIEFIKSSRLSQLKGQSIFKVDLKSIQRQLQLQYPEISQLRVSRRYPDQILVLAKKRIQFAYVVFKNESLILDSEGIVLDDEVTTDKRLPLIIDQGKKIVSVRLGHSLKDKNIQTALIYIKIFRANKYLASYKVHKIDVSNLSQIELYLTETLKIILDDTDINDKVQMLSLMLSQAKLNLNEINYIDLRFKEPIISKNIIKEEK